LKKGRSQCTLRGLFGKKKTAALNFAQNRRMAMIIYFGTTPGRYNNGFFINRQRLII